MSALKRAVEPGLVCRFVVDLPAAVAAAGGARVRGVTAAPAEGEHEDGVAEEAEEVHAAIV
jgi:hypothetical protein